MNQKLGDVWNHSVNFLKKKLQVFLGENLKKKIGISWRRWSEENEGNRGGN